MSLCVIPARGGSKRIPRKNIKEFLGKPIIAYSIEAAVESGCFKKIIVSTDDNEIAKIAIKYGAEVPFTRPNKLSDDYSNTLSVVKHAIEQIDFNSNIENVCCLYATAPFIDAKTIYQSYEQFINSEASYCLGITNFSFPVQKALRVSDKNRLEMLNEINSNKNSQDLEEMYHDAGQFCWGKASAFMSELSIYSGLTLPYVLKRNLVQDIDTIEDWIRAEAMYKLLKLS
jgi:pseudaminic acid cytidylyltransferase